MDLFGEMKMPHTKHITSKPQRDTIDSYGVIYLCIIKGLYTSNQQLFLALLSKYLPDLPS